MRIGRYEFGWIRPVKWHKYWRTDAENPCGCTIWEFGFWYFTILRYECAGESDPRPESVYSAKLAQKEASKELKKKLRRKRRGRKKGW